MVDKWEVFGGKRICRETEVLGENVFQCHYDYGIPHMAWCGTEPGPPL
jgi:hypothetical protein